MRYLGAGVLQACLARVRLARVCLGGGRARCGVYVIACAGAGACASPRPVALPVVRAALADPGHPLWRERAPAVFRVRVETTQGAFVVEARRAWAPFGADRFYQLVRAGFFDDSRFFRVRAGFVAQFGIAGDPAVAGVWRAAAMPDDPVRRSNTRGAVSYAMTGPNTRTTQLFVNLADNARLDAQGFAPLGTVVAGMDVVDRLYAGYGEAAGGGMRGGQQAPLFAGGNAYLDRAYPRLDRVRDARVVRPPASTGRGP